MEALRAFPAEARREVGHDLFLIQQGESPRDWKPMRSVGTGAKEVRVSTWSGGRLEHRVINVANSREAVYVLHAFRMTTTTTNRQDRREARRSYREMLDLRKKRS